MSPTEQAGTWTRLVRQEREIFLAIYCFLICLISFKILVASTFERAGLKKIVRSNPMKDYYVIFFYSTC